MIKENSVQLITISICKFRKPHVNEFCIINQICCKFQNWRPKFCELSKIFLKFTGLNADFWIPGSSNFKFFLIRELWGNFPKFDQIYFHKSYYEIWKAYLESLWVQRTMCTARSEEMTWISLNISISETRETFLMEFSTVEMHKIFQSPDL